VDFGLEFKLKLAARASKNPEKLYLGGQECKMSNGKWKM
jgi:hypothetical protein